MCLSVFAEIERFFTGLSLFIYYQNRETITIGTTSLLPKEVEDLVRRMGLDYTGCSYHLIDRYILHVEPRLLQTLRNQKNFELLGVWSTNNQRKEIEWRRNASIMHTSLQGQQEKYCCCDFKRNLKNKAWLIGTGLNIVLNWTKKKVKTKNTWLFWNKFNVCTGVHCFFRLVTHLKPWFKYVIEGKIVSRLKWSEVKQKLLWVSRRFELARVKL